MIDYGGVLLGTILMIISFILTDGAIANYKDKEDLIVVGFKKLLSSVQKAILNKSNHEDVFSKKEVKKLLQMEHAILVWLVFLKRIGFTVKQEYSV